MGINYTGFDCKPNSKRKSITMSVDLDSGEFYFFENPYLYLNYEETLRLSKKLSSWVNSIDKKGYEEFISKSVDEQRSFILPKNQNTPRVNHLEKSVYLIGDSNKNFLKIGMSSNPEERLSELNTSNPFNLEIVSVIKGDLSWLEAHLHKKFEYLRISGEWFEYKQEIINEFKRLNNE